MLGSKKSIKAVLAPFSNPEYNFSLRNIFIKLFQPANCHVYVVEKPKSCKPQEITFTYNNTELMIKKYFFEDNLKQFFQGIR